MFDTIISELDDYGIIPVRIREEYRTGHSHKRSVIIYDEGKIYEIRCYFENFKQRIGGPYMAEKL